MAQSHIYSVRFHDFGLLCFGNVLSTEHMGKERASSPKNTTTPNPPTPEHLPTAPSDDRVPRESAIRFGIAAGRARPAGAGDRRSGRGRG